MKNAAARNVCDCASWRYAAARPAPGPDELEGHQRPLAIYSDSFSTLSRHAEEMFGNLFREAEILRFGASSLQARIDKIAVR